MDNQARAIEVRTTRKTKGWTQEQLAERSGMKVRTIRNLEAGKNVAPSTMALVYTALGLGTGAPSWPADVDAFLQMVGYRLTSMEESDRLDMIARVTRMLIGR